MPSEESREGAGPRSRGTERSPLQIEVTEAAATQMRAALQGKAAEYAVRLFVGGGAHPAVGMSVDRGSDRDEKLEIRGIPFVIDTGSRPFLDGARVDYLVTAEGAGFSVTGPNTPSPGPAPPSPRTDRPGKGSEGAEPPKGFESAARASLKQVYDPEIPMNIVDLGLIYELKLNEGGEAQVRMTMTTPGCPVIEMLLDQVKTAVATVPGVSKVDVEVVWDPPWSPERMSEFAKRQLGFA